MRIGKKILFVADVPLENPSSGSEQVLFQQASGLAKNGLDVFALTRQNGCLPPVHRQVSGLVREACYSVQTKNTFNFFLSLFKESSRQFDLLLKDQFFDAAVCHHPFTYFSLLISGKIRGAPILHVFHSPTHMEYSLLNEMKGPIRNFLPVKGRWLVEKYCHEKATEIMVLSHYMKRKVIETYGIPSNKIVVNPGGVDLIRFRPVNGRQLLKRKLGLPDKKIHLLSVRNLEPRMGLDNLLKAIKLIKKSIEVHLTICGDGPERKNLQGLINEFGLIHDVTLTGFISSEQLPKYYAASDFFILPTRKLEGFGLVTPEAMASGTPVLGTPIGGTKEILANFNNDCLFSDSSPEAIAIGIKKTVRYYSNNPKEYENVRRRCRRHAEHNYSWQRHVENLKSEIIKITQLK
jgi:glycosyltransferase involved in cell wall biosynthesis